MCSCLARWGLELYLQHLAAWTWENGAVTALIREKGRRNDKSSGKKDQNTHNRPDARKAATQCSDCGRVGHWRGDPDLRDTAVQAQAELPGDQWCNLSSRFRSKVTSTGGWPNPMCRNIFIRFVSGAGEVLGGAPGDVVFFDQGYVVAHHDERLWRQRHV